VECRDLTVFPKSLKMKEIGSAGEWCCWPEDSYGTYFVC
jgi:hypothetical protein